jgi:fibro-slime domain-containing protein
VKIRLCAIVFSLIMVLAPCTNFTISGENTNTTHLFVDQEWWDGINYLNFNCGYNIGNNSLGQSFIPSKNVLASVDLYLTFVNPNGGVNLTIFKAKENGYPDISNPLANVHLNDNAFLSKTFGKYNFDFPDISVIPGEIYFIVVQSGIGYNWRDTHPLNGGNYPNGSSWCSLDRENSGYEIPNNDFLFRTYYSYTLFPPVANAGQDCTVSVNDQVVFSAESSYDPDGTIVQYKWNFGDGISGNGSQITHSYMNSGTYKVILEVIDNDGLQNSTFIIVSVLDVPIEIEEYLGYYYNLPSDHPEVEGNITGVVTGDSPFNHDWYDAQYFSFSRLDGSLTFGSNFFPVNEGQPGDPYYFAVHWITNMTVYEAGNYTFTVGSDDDSWVYVNNQMVSDLGGVHAYDLTTKTIYLDQGTYLLNIYFAERHMVQSIFYFSFFDSYTNENRECFFI